MDKTFWTETWMMSVEVNDRGAALDSDQRVLEEFGNYTNAEERLRESGWTPRHHEPGESRRTTTFVNSRAKQNTDKALKATAAKQKAERESLNWDQYHRVAVQPGGFVCEFDSGLHRGIATFESQTAGVQFLQKLGWMGPYRQRCPNDDQHMINPKGYAPA